jgi:hypothetical protein
MEDYMLIQAGFACMQVLIAIALIAVGAVVVRPADQRAGFLTIGIGALLFVSACCATTPSMMMRFGSMGFESYQVILDCASAVRMALAVAAGGLAIAAPIALARKLIAERGGQ